MKKLKKTIFNAFFVALLAFVYGCAPVISKETLSSVDSGLIFSDIAKSPDSYVGRKVLLGGFIVKTENLKDTTMVEVLQAPLDSDYKPDKPETSQGRFLVEFAGFKDPAVYFIGRRMTVAGRIKKPETRPLDKTTYTYVVLKPDEHYLWRGGRDEPSVHFGIGLGFSHSF